MTIKLLKVLSTETQLKLRKLLDTESVNLTKDISSYARGRNVFWLEHRANLTKVNGGKLFYPAVHNLELWKFCSKVYAKATENLATENLRINLPIQSKIKNALLSDITETHSKNSLNNSCSLSSPLKTSTLSFDLGLVAYGNKGISWHRDATYANYPAVSINLSTEDTLWGYKECRIGYDGKTNNPNPEENIYILKPGSVILFNCKNPHAVIKCDSTRYSIILWNINPKYTENFKKYKDGLNTEA